MTSAAMHAVRAADARAAQVRIAHHAVRTPLVQVAPDLAPSCWLKLENLQPIGSFKIRGAANAMLQVDKSRLQQGVYTASAGNMAQGVAWCAREAGISCAVVAPDTAPQAKTDAIERLGARVIKVPFERWWQTLVERSYPGLDGLFIHPFADSAVMAGNGTIALELLDDLPNIDAVFVPLGGGGLVCGIAAVLRELSPQTKVYVVEVETAAPLTASLSAGCPTRIEMTRTFVDGMGSSAVAGEMWPLLSTLVAATRVVRIAEVENAIRILASRCRVVAEGAGAAGFAAALRPEFRDQRTVAIVSGGNIDLHTFASILQSRTS